MFYFWIVLYLAIAIYVDTVLDRTRAPFGTRTRFDWVRVILRVLSFPGAVVLVILGAVIIVVAGTKDGIAEEFRKYRDRPTKST